MTDALIHVRDLSKTYRVPVREAGLSASLRSLVRRSYSDVEAVREISFEVATGEMVALLGPNGAGKTTTLKMLSGLLHPTAGEATVAGFCPWERRHAYLRSISMVLGNKSQMHWDIPPLDTFMVLSEIYSLTSRQFQRRLDELVSLLDMESVLTKPVRDLSLGERMKCELVAGLLHHPQVLFLDEPTLGLDVSMQRRFRQFIREFNSQHGVTVILTSHYMADVMALCSRVILIHRGALLYDGDLSALAERLAPYKLIRLSLGEEVADTELSAAIPDGAEIIGREEGQLVLRVDRSRTPSITSALLQSLPVTDLAVEDPPIEAVIDRIYQEVTL